MDTDTLRARLTECANGLRQAWETFANEWGIGDGDPYLIRDEKGHPILAGILIAEGQVLAALAQLPIPTPIPEETWCPVCQGDVEPLIIAGAGLAVCPNHHHLVHLTRTPQ